MEIFARSVKGPVRKVNEDRLLVRQYGPGSCLLAVADGMGGLANGALAATIATGVLTTFDPELPNIAAHMEALFQAANEAVREKSLENGKRRRMGTTLDAVFIQDMNAYWTHVGDSRVHLFRDGLVKPLTEDHNVPGLMVKKGDLSDETAQGHPLGSMLMKFIGGMRAAPDSGQIELKKNDILFASSDGLHGFVPHEAIASILSRPNPLKERINSLVSAAMTVGSTDNITVAGVSL